MHKEFTVTFAWAALHEMEKERQGKSTVIRDATDYLYSGTVHI